jgi:hypothetical protein
MPGGDLQERAEYSFTVSTTARTVSTGVPGRIP